MFGVFYIKFLSVEICKWPCHVSDHDNQVQKTIFTNQPKNPRSRLLELVFFDKVFLPSGYWTQQIDFTDPPHDFQNPTIFCSLWELVVLLTD